MHAVFNCESCSKGSLKSKFIACLTSDCNNSIKFENCYSRGNIHGELVSVFTVVFCDFNIDMQVMSCLINLRRLYYFYFSLFDGTVSRCCVSHAVAFRWNEATWISFRFRKCVWSNAFGVGSVGFFRVLWVRSVEIKSRTFLLLVSCMSVSFFRCHLTCPSWWAQPFWHETFEEMLYAVFFL